MLEFDLFSPRKTYETSKIGLAPIVAGISVRYTAQLALWESYEVHTRVAGWDEKWLYMEQIMYKYGFDVFLCFIFIFAQFEQNRMNEKRTVAARAMLRATMQGKKGLMPPSVMLEALGEHSAPSKLMPPAVVHFDKAEHGLFRAMVEAEAERKRDEAEGSRPKESSSH